MVSHQAALPSFSSGLALQEAGQKNRRCYGPYFANCKVCSQSSKEASLIGDGQKNVNVFAQ